SAHPLQVGLLNDRHQCAFCTASGLQQTRKEAAVAHPRHLQLDRAHTRIPRSLAVTVSVPSAVSGAFVALSTDMLGEFHLHQFLSQYPHSLAQKISLLHACLAQHFGKCHSQFVGHRKRFLSSGLDNAMMRTTRWPFASTTTFTQLWGHY